MAKQSAGFVHEHIEKVVVGLGAAFLVAAIWFGFASGRFDVNGTSPGDLIKNIGESADQAASNILNAKPPTESDAGLKDDATVTKLLAWYGPNSKSIGENAGVSMKVARAREFPPLFISTTEVSDEDKHELARLVEPDMPVVATGRSTLEIPVERPPLDEYEEADRQETKNEQVNWVAVASQVNLKQQDLNFKTEKYPPNSYMNIVKVHLQRRDRDEMWRGWLTVDTWLPFEPIDRPPASQSGKLNAAVDPRQEAIARPQLPKRVEGDRIEYEKILPFLDAPPKRDESLERRAKDWVDRAEAAEKARDAESMMIFARAAMGVRNAPSKVLDNAKDLYRKAMSRLGKRYRERWQDVPPPDKMMPIVAYDMTAVPGHTYQYRMRYEVVNLYAGPSRQAELRNPSDAGMVTLFSDWSPSTSPVKVESDLQFYLTDARQDRDMVEVTVWKRNRRKWEKQPYRLAVGDAIGKKDKNGADFTTGAVVVDIRFNESVNGKQETVLVYVTSDGSLHEAILSIDRKLNEEQKRAA